MSNAKPAPRKRATIREVAQRRDARILAPNSNHHGHAVARFAWSS